jgi:hypothetical protein
LYFSLGSADSAWKQNQTPHSLRNTLSNISKVIDVDKRITIIFPDIISAIVVTYGSDHPTIQNTLPMRIHQIHRFKRSISFAESNMGMEDMGSNKYIRLSLKSICGLAHSVSLHHC